MLEAWRAETLEQRQYWPDAGLVEEGLAVLAECGKPAAGDVVLATDLHAGNVLRATREPWLVIDPKPFVGDRAYDLVQHLLNCEGRLVADARWLVSRVADLAGVDEERLRRWVFGRTAADPRGDWSEGWRIEVARQLAS